MQHGDELSLRPLRDSDAAILADVFAAIGWSKPETLFRLYLREQGEGRRWVCVAEWDGVVAGYTTVLWESEDPRFRELRIPEVADLNVLPDFRRRGIGQALLSEAETEVSAQSDVIGIRVGLHSGYGSAQRLYVRSGYLPDGAGVVRNGAVVDEEAMVPMDDETTLRLTKDSHADPFLGAVS